MKMKKQLTRLVLASLSIFAFACNQSDPAPKGDYVRGVFVINEGNFSQNNGAISFFSREMTNAVDDLFKTVNGADFQGGGQGYTVIGDEGFILVDNDKGSDRVEIVNSNTFEKVATLVSPEIENPREIVGSSNKAYISCWGANADFNYQTGYIAVIDVSTNKVIKKINIGAGPENLVYHNGKLLVGTYSSGGGNTLTIINTATDQIEKTVTLNGVPSPIGVDANGKLWVAASNQAVRMNAETYAVEAVLPIGSDVSKSAENFVFSSDRKTIFFVLSYYNSSGIKAGETYKFDVGATQINLATPLIKRAFTGLAVDPLQSLIYAGVTPNYGQAGYAVRYRTDGSVVDSIKVGVAPTGFFFK
jgi:YVTN family beta-propeller protein